MKTVPLSDEHNRKDFNCGDDKLNRFLKENATQSERKDLSRTFVIEGAEKRILGYVSIAAASIEFDHAPAVLTKKLPNYPIHVSLIARLATDVSVRGQGIGKFLLLDALYRSFEASQNVPAVAVVVDAKNKAAQGFYEKFEFVEITNSPTRLFLAMSTVGRLFKGET